MKKVNPLTAVRTKIERLIGESEEPVSEITEFVREANADIAAGYRPALAVYVPGGGFFQCQVDHLSFKTDSRERLLVSTQDGVFVLKNCFNTTVTENSLRNAGFYVEPPQTEADDDPFFNAMRGEVCAVAISRQVR